jgi:hypothetical protein
MESPRLIPCNTQYAVFNGQQIERDNPRNEFGSLIEISAIFVRFWFNWIMSTDYCKIFQYKLWRISTYRYPCCFKRKDWRTDMMELLYIFFAIHVKVPTIGSCCSCACLRTWLILAYDWRNLLSVCLFAEPTTDIIGGPDLYIDRGSTINLTCVVLYSPEPPAYIFWNHNEAVSPDHFSEHHIYIK